MIIELAKEEDVPAILAIANAAAVISVANFATEPETIGEWLDSWRKTQASYPWLVARSEAGGEIIGFAKGSPHRARGAYRWSAEVTVYVSPAHHGARLGTELYRRLIPILRAQGYATLLAGITLPNPASERLHAAFGFVRCAVYHRVGWKLGTWHDVGYSELHLMTSTGEPDPIRPVSEVWPMIRDGA